MMVASDSTLFFAVVLAFTLVAHPQTYRVVNKLFKSMFGGPRLVNEYGVATTTGVLAHALVAGLVTLILVSLM